MNGAVASPSTPSSPARVIFLSFIMSENQLEQVSRLDPTPAIQTHRFAIMMAGLLRRVFPDLASYNFVPIQDFPVGRKFRFKRSRFRRDGHDHYSLSFINALVLKHLTRFGSLLRLYREMAGYDFLIVHGLHMPNLAFAVLLRSARVRIGLLLTDEHGIALPTDGLLRRAMRRIDGRLVRWLCGWFDFSIALSPALAATYAPGRPTAVFPGIYNDELAARVAALPVTASSDGAPFRVVYFGNLNAAYGVQALIDALPFLATGIELRLFGRGPLEATIAELAAATDNLHWGGLVDEEGLTAEMADCDLLINARPADSRLAQMSSPSKLLEYAASGKAVATTRLTTIPPEVMAHCIPIEASTGPAVADAIIRAAKLPETSRAALGRDFQQEVRRRYCVDTLQRDFVELFEATVARDSGSPGRLDVKTTRG